MDYFKCGFGMKNEWIIFELFGWVYDVVEIWWLLLCKEVFYCDIVCECGIVVLLGVVVFLYWL